MTHHLHSNAATSAQPACDTPVAGVGSEGVRTREGLRGKRPVPAVRPPVPGGPPADALPAPPPRRVRPPRWLDLRLVLGVLLVLGSVLLGARVVSSADATVPVWAAAGDLAAGTVLSGNDLVAVDGRPRGAAGREPPPRARPAGAP